MNIYKFTRTPTGNRTRNSTNCTVHHFINK